MHGMSRADDGLGGNAADVEAVSPHHPLLYERHLGTHSCAASRRHQPTSARANHHKIVPAAVQR